MLWRSWYKLDSGTIIVYVLKEHVELSFEDIKESMKFFKHFSSIMEK